MIKALQWRCQGDKQDSHQLYPGCRCFLVYLVSKGPQQLGGLKKPHTFACTNETTANPCNTTGQGAGGDVAPQPSVPLLSPLPGQFLWGSAPSWCSVCFAA